jgi:hypothetical protein
MVTRLISIRFATQSALDAERRVVSKPSVMAGHGNSLDFDTIRHSIGAGRGAKARIEAERHGGAW